MSVALRASRRVSGPRRATIWPNRSAWSSGGRMREFDGRVGVVTGAGRGIGLAMAGAMVRHGMRVVLSGLEPAEPERAANALRTGGSEVVGMVCDVSDPIEVEELATRIVERFGRVDLLCNNAGVVAGGRTWDISQDDWRRVLSVNLWGAIHGVRSFIPLLMAQPGGGHVVNVASLAVVNPWPGSRALQRQQARPAGPHGDTYRRSARGWRQCRGDRRDARQGGDRHRPSE